MNETIIKISSGSGMADVARKHLEMLLDNYYVSTEKKNVCIDIYPWSNGSRSFGYLVMVDGDYGKPRHFAFAEHPNVDLIAVWEGLNFDGKFNDTHNKSEVYQDTIEKSAEYMFKLITDYFEQEEVNSN